MSAPTAFDIIVIGAGPAGQKAAIQGAKAGKHVALIERERGIGGSCVYRGTIPSKTLRESALQLDRLKSAGAVFEFSLKPDIQIATLLGRLEAVVSAHDIFMSRQLRRNGISLLHGRAGFLDARTIEMLTVDGGRQILTADAIILATGSRPRNPEDTPVDHEHILDSDSLLSMIYLPRSLTIIGGGVIGCEYASIFALLGTQVTLIDRAPSPLQFMDHELVTHFVKLFEQQGGRYLGGQQILEVRWDGAAHVVTTLKDNPPVKSEKLLVALGRQANIEDLNLAAAGLTATEKGTPQSTSSARRMSRTSTPSATWSDLRHWPQRRWNKGAEPPGTPSTCRSAMPRRPSPLESTPFLKWPASVSMKSLPVNAIEIHSSDGRSLKKSPERRYRGPAKVSSIWWQTPQASSCSVCRSWETQRRNWCMSGNPPFSKAPPSNSLSTTSSTFPPRPRPIVSPSWASSNKRPNARPLRPHNRPHPLTPCLQHPSQSDASASTRISTADRYPASSA